MADTCWSGFTHPDYDEWQEYLDFRREQNFNAVQINLLQQRQSCLPRIWRHPFFVKENGEYDYSKINPEYFEHVCQYLDEMVRRDLQPLIVLLWGNFAPGTWQGKIDSKRRNVEDKPYYLPMSFLEMENFLRYVIPLLKKYNPVFMVSGDVDLSEEDYEIGEMGLKVLANPVTVDFYAKALEITKKLAPECLTTLHIAPMVTLPRRLMCSDYLDFYMYQPGHTHTAWQRNRILAEEIRAYPIVKPVYNSETSYEANIYFDKTVGRFGADDVRRAFWQGVLAGANAGFTYGAGGIWLWRQSQNYCSERGDSGAVNDWRDDLRLPGSYDMGFAKLLADVVGVYDLIPRKDLIMDNPQDEIGCAASRNNNKIVIYLPFSWPVKIRMELEDYEISAIDLETRWAVRAKVRINDGYTEFQQFRYNHDYLIVAIKKNKQV